MDHLDSKRFQGWATFLLVVAVGALLLPARAWAEDPPAVQSMRLSTTGNTGGVTEASSASMIAVRRFTYPSRPS